MDGQLVARSYRLMAPDGSTYESDRPGLLGGNRQLRTYGRLDCGSALAALPRGYARVRVFFADEATAIAAGFRPCGTCLRARYQVWRRGGMPGSPLFPWLISPSPSAPDTGSGAPADDETEADSVAR